MLKFLISFWKIMKIISFLSISLLFGNHSHQTALFALQTLLCKVYTLQSLRRFRWQMETCGPELVVYIVNSTSES